MFGTVLVLSVIYITMAFFEGSGLIKKEHWRELIAFSLLWLIALIFSLLLAIGVKIPSYEKVLLKLFS